MSFNSRPPVLNECPIWGENRAKLKLGSPSSKRQGAAVVTAATRAQSRKKFRRDRIYKKAVLPTRHDSNPPHSKCHKRWVNRVISDNDVEYKAKSDSVKYQRARNKRKPRGLEGALTEERPNEAKFAISLLSRAEKAYLTGLEAPSRARELTRGERAKAREIIAARLCPDTSACRWRWSRSAGR
jgi:hypothetical protein